MSPSTNQTSSVGVTVQLIQDAIAANGGCIPFSQFMEISLYGPQGYYSSGKAQFGIMGHFETSPEVSPRFGASIGRQLAHTWDAMGRPPRFEIVEMGAGSGSLAESLLEDARLSNPDFFWSINYRIVECGDLIEGQQRKLQQFHDRPSPIVSWIRGSALDLQVGQISGAFISNELLDTFPAEIVTLRDGRVRQMYVEDHKVFGLRPTWRDALPEVRRYVNEFGIHLNEGVEEPVNFNAIKLQRSLCSSLRRGVILTIDYGDPGEVGRFESSAVRIYGPGVGDLPHDQRLRRALTWPGRLDLTTSVNFAPLQQIAKEDGLEVVYSGSQEGFLRGCGILSFSGGDEEGMPLHDRRLIADSDLGGCHTQFLAKGVPNLAMRCRTTPNVRNPSSPAFLSM